MIVARAIDAAARQWQDAGSIPENFSRRSYEGAESFLAGQVSVLQSLMHPSVTEIEVRAKIVRRRKEIDAIEHISALRQEGIADVVNLRGRRAWMTP